jgi:hypothetical protein
MQQHIDTRMIFIIRLRFDFGIRYVRYVPEADGTWITGRFLDAKEWKTRAGAARWLAARPELQSIATIDGI